jgi:uncharacterized hydrophobic protein (TIGR00271 family)
MDHFRLGEERQDAESVVDEVYSGVEFTGTNLWILVFAIFIASLGLNVNSSAVVIGAMLVSPLMGPIMGLGLGMATNDLGLLKKAMVNYSFALFVGLAASTVYFLFSPLKEASSEILARTAPNVYDVLIALFGGFAGVLAVCSKKRANVVPGVAIATALMPPLCTAGYGFANGNLGYAVGALYLFIINTVFIAFATLITARFLNFPYKRLPEKRDETIAKRVVWLVVLVTAAPSVYFAYDIIKQNRFQRRADEFVEKEAIFPNDYLLDKAVDGKSRSIVLTFGGEAIDQGKIDELKSKLHNYQLDGATLEIQQGFAYLNDDDKTDERTKRLSSALTKIESELKTLQETASASANERALQQEMVRELRSGHPNVVGCSVQRLTASSDPDTSATWSIVVTSTKKLTAGERSDIAEQMRSRLSDPTAEIYFDSL